MSEETERPDSAPESLGSSIDPVAVALALGGASQAQADAFLKKQEAFIEDQRRLIAEQQHHLHKQYTQLCLGIWQLRLGVLLRVATALVGIALAGALAFLIWDASRSNGLLIEPFSVPPDLAQTGMTGQVVAAQMLDQLVAMQAQTTSQRAPKSYVNSWDERGIKLDIPETGVSLAELYGFLRDRLGHDTRVSGEIVRTPSGISLTVRAGSDGADRVTGPDSDLDGLIQRSAESLYRLTQPYRYAIYAGNHGRADEAEALFRDLADRGPPADRSWANNGLSMPTSDRFGVDAALDMLEQGAKIEPANAIIRLNEVMLEIQKSRPEQALHHVTDLLARPPGESSGIIRAEAIPLIHLGAQAQSDILQGAYIDAAIKQEIVNKSRIAGRYGLPAIPAQIATHAHDPATARAIFDRYISPGSQNLMRGISTLYDAWTRAMIATELQDWRGVLSEANTLDPVLPAFPGLRTITPTTIVPLTAYAKAELGDFASAEAAIAATPPNCYDCLIARARIAELNGEHDRADFWFARAVHDAPTIPFAYSNWGEALLARGHADAAIEQFKLANQKGPHFADPLEGWGEALMAKNQSHLALAKFAEAEKYAPNWGRLHLKWGEALVYAGKKNEAKAQFIRAAQLDLTTAERFELARVGPHD